MLDARNVLDSAQFFFSRNLLASKLLSEGGSKSHKMNEGALIHNWSAYLVLFFWNRLKCLDSTSKMTRFWSRNDLRGSKFAEFQNKKSNSDFSVFPKNNSLQDKFQELLIRFQEWISRIVNSVSFQSKTCFNQLYILCRPFMLIFTYVSVKNLNSLRQYCMFKSCLKCYLTHVEIFFLNFHFILFKRSCTIF